MNKLFISLIILSGLIFATAPDWVKSGTKVDYSVSQNGGSSMSVSYQVTDRTANEIKISLTVDGSSGGKPTDNATGDAGSFWYDKSKIASADPSEDIGGWTVMEVDVSLSIAGKTWNAVKLRKTIAGLQTIDSVDKETGLLLKRENSAQTVTFKSINPPFSQPAPAPQPNPSPNPNPSPSPSPSPSPQPTPQPQQSNQSVQSNSTAPAEITPEMGADLKPADSTIPCCPVAFIFLLVIGMAYKR